MWVNAHAIRTFVHTRVTSSTSHVTVTGTGQAGVRIPIRIVAGDSTATTATVRVVRSRHVVGASGQTGTGTVDGIVRNITDPEYRTTTIEEYTVTVGDWLPVTDLTSSVEVDGSGDMITEVTVSVEVVASNDCCGDPCCGDPCCDDPCAAQCNPSPCDPACGGSPCAPGCGNAACDPACGGDPCSPGCGGDPCDPACGGDPCSPGCGNPECDPACGGDPCSLFCNNAPCDPNCGGNPCDPSCGDPDCDPACGGDPCSPTCDGSECDPNCGGNPCDPACGDPDCNPSCGGGRCDPSCDSTECNPACGGDPCDPGCGDPDCNPACGGGGPCDANCDTAPCDPACGGDPCDPNCSYPDPCCDSNDPCCNLDCDDGDACTSDSCDGGDCSNVPITCQDDGDPCTTQCCLAASGCGVTHPAQPCELDLDVSFIVLCKEGSKTLTGTIANTSQCQEQYTLSVQMAAGAPFTLGFQPPGVALGGMQSAPFSVTISTQANAIPGNQHILTIKATSMAEGICPPLNQSGCTATLYVQIEAVDLDVDSNNSGGYDPAAGIGDSADADGNGLFDEDEHENDPWTPPSFVGKYIWTNNDDSNGNGTLDFEFGDAQTVDGGNDLSDLFILRARPIDTQLAQQPHVFLQLNTGAFIRVFSARATNAVPILGAGVPDDGDGDPLRRNVDEYMPGLTGHDFAFEGVAPGPTWINLQLYDGDALVCEDQVVVTVGVLEATWLTAASATEPIEDPNNHPTDPDDIFPLGVKYFPDADASGEVWNDVVTVKVQTTPPADGIKIYFKAFDPDDPSASGNVVDQETNQAGGDNRDETHLDTSSLIARDAVTMTTPVAQGAAFVPFRVAHQPGDNHRVAGTMKFPALTLLNDNNVPPSGTAALAPHTSEVSKFIGDLTPLLTIWRELHVETDTMLRPTYAQNTVTTFWNDPVLNPLLTLDVGDQDDNDNFTNGWIRIKATGFPDIVTRIIQFNHSPLDDVIQTSVTAAAWGARPNSGQCEFSDDDLSDEQLFTAASVGSDIGIGLPPAGNLPIPDLALMESRYAHAYILPVHRPEHTSLGLPFVKNMLPAESASWSAFLPTRGLPFSVLEYWTVYVVGAFQAEDSEDCDVEATGTKGINTHTVYPGGYVSTTSDFGPQYTGMCAIYLETLDDAYGEHSGRITVVHETAHTLGVDHTTDLMDAENQGDWFAPVSLKELRSYKRP